MLACMSCVEAEPKRSVSSRLRHHVREALAHVATLVIPAETRRRLAEKMPYLPLAVWDQARAGRRYDAAFFEEFYAHVDDDPYAYAASPIELEKYEHTLDACGPGPFASAFELACGTGLFTALLAPRCRSLLAVDISAVAVARTRERTASYPQVRCERRTLPAEMPDGPFDLIVCSDVLVYWPEDDLRAAARELESRLASGGRLVVVDHVRGVNLPGARVHEILREELDLEVTLHEELERHLVDRFEKSSAGRRVDQALPATSH
jgi:SAM-dependent methyltransferase